MTERGPTMRRPLSLPALAHVAVLTVLAAWTSSHLFPPINLDVGALLYVAKRWLAGDRLYIDVIDVNMPWAIGLHVPAEYIAARLGLDGPTWFSIHVCLALGLSIGLTQALVRRHEPEFGRVLPRVLPLALLFTLGVDPGHSFGQREHLLMIAACPYLVLSTLRAEGIRVAPGLCLVIALVAGLGFAIKPHFVLPLLLVELLLLHRRGFRATFRDVVPWAIGGMLAAHVALTLFLTPEYFSTIVPYAAATYGSPALTLARGLAMLIGPQFSPMLLVLPILAFVAFMRGGQLPRLLAVFAIGSAAMAVLQGKGWDYHAIPAMASMLLLTIVVIAEAIDEYASGATSPTHGTARLIAACLIAPLLFLDARRLQPFMDQIQYAQSYVHDWVEIMERDQGGNNSALVLSGGIYPQFPAINYAGFKMAMPFLTMWPLAGLYRACAARERGYRPIERQSAAEGFFFHKVVAGFVGEKPELLVVDTHTGMADCSGRPFEFLAYFMRDPAFARAFAAYRPIRSLGQYVFYERRGEALSAAPPVR